MSQNNSIEFQSAMQNFHSMFPEIDSELIEEILRLNKGSVEKTIDQLLTISSDNQEGGLALEEKSSEEERTTKAPEKTSRNRWNPILLKDLDQNFLRITADSDEFAVMLQNEEFLNSLRYNHDFISSLDSEGSHDKPLEERLKNMGKASRKKFTQLAKIFTFQRKKTSQKPKSKLLSDDYSDDEAKK